MRKIFWLSKSNSKLTTTTTTAAGSALPAITRRAYRGQAGVSIVKTFQLSSETAKDDH